MTGGPRRRCNRREQILAVLYGALLAVVFVAIAAGLLAACGMLR